MLSPRRRCALGPSVTSMPGPVSHSTHRISLLLTLERVGQGMSMVLLPSWCGHRFLSHLLLCL